MNRAHIGLLALILLLAGCGDDGVTDTTVSSRQAPAPEEEQTDQTPPPETTPGRTSPTTVPTETATTPSPGGGANYDYDYGGSGDDADTTDTTQGANGSEGTEATGGIQVANSELGNILVGPEGMTLYVFLADDQGESTCYDACEATWPPLEGDIQAGAGVDEELLGTTEREDGSTQATYDGWPLYYYASDSEPGDITGQGVGDSWFVIDPAGEVVDG